MNQPNAKPSPPTEPSASPLVTTNPWPGVVSRLGLAALVIIGIIFGLRMFIRAPVSEMERAAGVWSKYFSSKDVFTETLGPLVSQTRLRRLQFFQRNQVCFFRIIRYRGKDGANHDFTDFFKREADKKPISELPVILNQYCEWEARGLFEFNFYIDLNDLSQWDIHWDETTLKLTLYAPDISANTPAELEPLVYNCIADSITISEKATRQSLEKKIPWLKQRLAQDQKRFMYEEAKVAIAGHFRDLIGKLRPRDSKLPLPEVIVVFPHERELDRSRL